MILSRVASSCVTTLPSFLARCFPWAPCKIRLPQRLWPRARNHDTSEDYYGLGQSGALNKLFCGVCLRRGGDPRNSSFDGSSSNTIAVAYKALILPPRCGSTVDVRLRGLGLLRLWRQSLATNPKHKWHRTVSSCAHSLCLVCEGVLERCYALCLQLNAEHDQGNPLATGCVPSEVF
jgi:hypothetical protein